MSYYQRKCYKHIYARAMLYIKRKTISVVKDFFVFQLFQFFLAAEVWMFLFHKKNMRLRVEKMLSLPATFHPPTQALKLWH